MGFGKNNTGAILRSTESIALSTLANETAIKFLSSITLDEDFRMLKAEIFAQVSGLAASEGNGLLMGIANGELTIAEITEAYLVDGPVDRNDRVKTERAERFVKTIAAAVKQLGTEAIFIGDEGGPKITVKPRWTFSNPEGWDLFIYNNTGAALQSGSTVRLVAVYYGVWLA